MKCQNDPVYFISNYVKITSLDEGIIKFQPWKFQEDVIDSLEKNRFVIAKLPRQSGKSTVIICGYFLWYILFHTDVSVALLANMEETAIMLLDRLKQSFELLPMFLKQGVEKWDQKLIKLANKARVRAAATSASAIRGDTFNIVFLDEFAFVPANIAEEFMASVFPVISSGKTTKLFIVSTPNGYNLFYKIFTQATEGKNSYKSLAYTWRDVFFARNPNATQEEAEKWRTETIQNMGNNLQKFQQEFECDFMGSANTLIAPWKLAQLSFRDPIETRGKLRIYKKPIYMSEEGPAHIYQVTVDVAQGQQSDSSVINVTDISVNPFEQCAVFQDDSIKPAQLAPVVRDLARYYANAYILVEINGEGLSVADMIATDLEYENVMMVYPHPKKGQRLSQGSTPKARMGLKTSELTKRIGATGLKSLIENDRMIIYDYETMHQLTTFVGKPNKKNNNFIYEAEVGNHDDCVIPLVLLGWLTMQQDYENYVGLSMRKELMAMKDPVILEPPFPGFFDDSAGPRVLGHTQNGYDIVEDVDFWGNPIR